MRWLIWIFSFSTVTGFGQTGLDDSEYTDGVIFGSSEAYGWSWTYKFGKKDYKLYLYYHYESPRTYLFEEGTYSLINDELTLTPKAKLLCEIEGLGQIDCMTAIGPEEGYLVHRDTLSKKQIIGFFSDRVCLISNDSNKLKFKDPSKQFATFIQRQKQ